MKTEKTTETQEKLVVLAGNPNVGKSVFFKALSGKYVDVSNFAGTTVEIFQADLGDNKKLIDTPGAYSITENNDESRIAREHILKSDIVINVLSATTLERDLFLTLQLLDKGLNVIVALNQFDEVKKKGIKIEVDRLQEILKVPVIKTSALQGEGIDEVRSLIVCHSELDSESNQYSKTDGQILNRTQDDILGVKNNDDYKQRRKRVNAICNEVLSYNNSTIKSSEKLGEFLLNPFWGVVSAFLFLGALYLILGDLIAQRLVDFLENDVITKYYVAPVSEFITKNISSTFIQEILAGEFGLLTMPIIYIFGVIMPLLIGFYTFMAVLEDSGYLSRLAVVVDRFFSKIGLNGRAVIPIILGFGCVTAALIATRILGSNREKIIASAMLALIIPCSAQLGIIVGIIAMAGGFWAWMVYIVTLLTVLAVVGTILNKLLPKKTTDLMIDIPPMRLPRLKNIAQKTYYKTKYFIKEAFPVFVFGCILINVLKVSGFLEKINHVLKPIAVSVLHLPEEFSQIFLMGILRRDFAAAGIIQLTQSNALSSVQIIVSLVVITLFVPCLMAVMALFKERGVKEATLIWFGSCAIAFGVGGILTRLLTLFS